MSHLSSLEKATHCVWVQTKRAALYKIGHWSKSWYKRHGIVDVCVCVSGHGGWDEQVCDKSLRERYTINSRLNPRCRLLCYFLSVLRGWDFSYPASLLSALCQSSLFHPAHNSFCWTPCATLPCSPFSSHHWHLSILRHSLFFHTYIFLHIWHYGRALFICFQCVWQWPSILTWDQGSANILLNACCKTVGSAWNKISDCYWRSRFLVDIFQTSLDLSVLLVYLSVFQLSLSLGTYLALK